MGITTGRMTRQGVTLKDVSAEAFIKEFAAHVKRSGKVELPSWHNVIKTGRYKELAPYDEDWYYVRLASIARKVYLRQKTGVGALRKVYGGADQARRQALPLHHLLGRPDPQDLAGPGRDGHRRQGREG